MLFEFETTPDKIEAAKARLRAILGDTRAFDGCEGVTVWQDEDRPTSFVLIEHWASRAHSDAYSKWREGRVDEDGLRALAASPPSKRHYGAVGA